MIKKKLISSFAVAFFSTIFVGGIFYLSDTRFKPTDDDEMFSWGFIMIYFSSMFVSSFFMERLISIFKKSDQRSDKINV